MKELLTTEELCKMLKVSRVTIHNWRKKGLPCIKIGKTIRYDYEEVMEWIESKNE